MDGMVMWNGGADGKRADLVREIAGSSLSDQNRFLPIFLREVTGSIPGSIWEKEIAADETGPPVRCPEWQMKKIEM